MLPITCRSEGSSLITSVTSVFSPAVTEKNVMVASTLPLAILVPDTIMYCPQSRVTGPSPKTVFQVIDPSRPSLSVKFSVTGEPPSSRARVKCVSYFGSSIYSCPA